MRRWTQYIRAGGARVSSCNAKMMDIASISRAVVEFLQGMWLGLPARREEVVECAVQADNQYLNAVPWIALLLLLLRSFMERY